MSGGAGAASPEEGDWRHIYDRIEAMLPRVEALAADRARLDALNRSLHARLLQAEASRRRWKTAYIELPLLANPKIAELQENDLEDSRNSQALFDSGPELEGAARHVAEISGNRGVDYEDVARDLRAELANLKNACQMLSIEPATEAQQDVGLCPHIQGSWEGPSSTLLSSFLSSNMSGDASKRMSIKEQARVNNMDFWPDDMRGDAAATSGHELEEHQPEVRDSDPEYHVEGGEDGTSSGDGGEHTTAGDDRTYGLTNGGDQTEPGGSNPAAQKKKKQRQRTKPRKVQSVDNVTDVITEVSPSGAPVMPHKVARGYSMQLGCILREGVPINTFDIRSDENAVLREHLLRRVHQRYTFPNPLPKNVENYAITKMSTALSSWKCRVKAKIHNKMSWEEISTGEPHITLEEFEEFKEFLNSEVCTRWTEWGKEMRKLNLGNHRLGSGGYKGKQPTWDKEDIERRRRGLDNPWDKFTDEQTRNFVRSRYYLNWETGEFVTDYDDVKKFQQNMEDELKAEAEAGPSSSQGEREVWDTSFNRAMNTYKDRDKLAPPTSAGRVSGYGTSVKFTEYYSSDGAGEKKKRKRTSKNEDIVEVERLKAELKKNTVDKQEVQKLVQEGIHQIMPPQIAEGFAAWMTGGQQEPIHVPSFSGSNSTMNRSPGDIVTPPPMAPLVTPALPTAPTREKKTPTAAAGTGARVSTEADLDAVTKVTN